MHHRHCREHGLVDVTHVDAVAMPSHDRDSLHAEPGHRALGLDIGGIVSDIGGVFKGAGEGAVETVTGIADAVTNPVDTAKGLASLVTDPTESWPALWHGLTNPIVEDWKAGNEGEAIGRGIFGVLEVIVGSKGVSKLGKVARKAPDAPTGRAALIERTFGALSPEDAAFAQRLNVRHVFEGDSFGGRHVAPGPGRYGDIDVIELKHTPGRTWKADVTYRDAAGQPVTKSTTMFPREWTPTEVLQSIRRAEADAVPTGKTRQIAGRDIDILEGEDRGLKLVIHRDAKTGEVLSAHPKHVNKPFTEPPS